MEVYKHLKLILKLTIANELLGGDIKYALTFQVRGMVTLRLNGGRKAFLMQPGRQPGDLTVTDQPVGGHRPENAKEFNCKPFLHSSALRDTKSTASYFKKKVSKEVKIEK